MADDDRDAILERRRRFVRLALAGLASASLGCSDAVREPDPGPCLGAPCTPEFGCGVDSGVDAGMEDLDAGSIVIRDSGTPDASTPTDGGADEGDAG